MATTTKNFRVKNGIDASGNITASGDVSGSYLKATNSSGDEGGEILLAIPQTNTTLSGTGVTIDLYQNKLRFFEQGGSARGYYIDITGGGGGASTNLVGGGAASDSFKTISVSGQGDVVADSSSDTLTLVAGTFVTITTVTASDSITFSASHSHAIDDLSDVTITSVTSGQVLKFSGSAWVNSADSDTTYTAGTGLTLNTSTNQFSNAGVLSINGTTGDVINIATSGHTHTIDNLSDVVITSATTNQTLVYSTTGNWVNAAASGGVTKGQAIIYAMVFG